MQKQIVSVVYFTAEEGVFGEACFNSPTNSKLKDIIWKDGTPDEEVLTGIHFCVQILEDDSYVVGVGASRRDAQIQVQSKL